MNIAWLMTNAIIGFCVSEVGSSVGAAVYEMVKNVSNYVWLKPEEGYFLDYPDDPEKETNLRTVIKRLQVMAQRNEKEQPIEQHI